MKALNPAPPRWGPPLLLAIVAYVPLLLTAAGRVGADTKTYLYLDPARLLSRAPSLWDPNIGLGTVTHQNIGYLWPMGPYYWLADAVGLPDWLAQRAWLGTVMLLAGLGVVSLLRTLGWRGRGVLVAAMAYMLSPYLLQYSARISVILLPWTALPWLISLTAKSLSTAGWRYPALMGLVVMTIGGVNVTSLIMIALAPLLWVFYATAIERHVTTGQALAAIGRIGVLTFGASLWSFMGLSLQSRYGIPIVRYTETYRTVAEASSATEAFRGLGYWFFYGNDALGPWIRPSVEYTNRTVLVALSFALPVLALSFAAVVRWRHRAYFALLIMVGGLMTVGSHPWSTTSALGGAFKWLTSVSDGGLAMRSTPRAAPMLVLGTAVFLGMGVEAVSRRVPRAALPATLMALALLAANLPAHFTGGAIEPNLSRQEAIPDYWNDAAAAMSAGSDPLNQTRVWELPGADFASYRWGNTVDPVTPGLTDRPYVARELIPYGTAPSAAMVNAIDRRLQEGTYDPESMAPMARLLGVGDIAYRADLQYERYRTPRPQLLWSDLLRTPGLHPPKTFGEPVPNIAGPERPLVDEIAQAIPPTAENPPPVSLFGVDDPLPITRVVSPTAPQLVSGDAEGLVDAAGAGLIDPERPVFLSGHLAAEPEVLDDALTRQAQIIITDTNRRQARRWGSVRENVGYTERADEFPLIEDPTDNRLEVFPDAGPDAQSVAEHFGEPIAADVSATAYGNPVAYIPEDRAVLALDDNPTTAWRVGAFSDVRGEKLIVEFSAPVTADVVTLLQPIVGPRNRWITRARIDLDTGESFDANLGPQSRRQPGQAVPLGGATFRRLDITVLETNINTGDYDGISGVGFANIDVGGVQVEELIRMPSDLTDRLGPDSVDLDLSVVATRQRANPAERNDAELDIRRIFTIPTERSFELSGDARLSSQVPEAVIDKLVGLPELPRAQSSFSLIGDARARAAYAIDGDPATRWSAPYGASTSHWLEVFTDGPTGVDRLDLEVIADQQHSVPTRVLIEGWLGDEAVASVTLDLPSITPADQRWATTTVPLAFEAMTIDRLRVSFPRVQIQLTPDWFSRGEIELPVAIAELGIPGVGIDIPSGDFVSDCLDDLLLIDTTFVSVQVRGTITDALDHRSLDISTCDITDPGTDDGDGDDSTADGDDPGASSALRLGAGDHSLRTSAGGRGLLVDQLVLRSLGEAATNADSPTDATTPTLTMTQAGRTQETVELTNVDGAFWLVLGQSHSDGWQADIPNASVRGPMVINGFANGWWVVPDDGVTELRATLTWTPQRQVWFGLGISAVVILLALFMVARGRRHSMPAVTPDPARPSMPVLSGLKPVVEPEESSRRWIALGFGGFAALNIAPGPAWLAIMIVVVLGMFIPGDVFGLLAALSFGFAAGLVNLLQFLNSFSPGFGWPQNFRVSHWFSLAALLFVGAGAVVEWSNAYARGQNRRGHDLLPAPPVGSTAGREYDSES